MQWVVVTTYPSGLTTKPEHRMYTVSWSGMMVLKVFLSRMKPSTRTSMNTRPGEAIAVAFSAGVAGGAALATPGTSTALAVAATNDTTASSRLLIADVDPSTRPVYVDALWRLGSATAGADRLPL